MEDVVLSLVVTLVALVVLVWVRRNHPIEEHPILYTSFAAHTASVFVQVWVIESVYGGGDIEGYYRSGVEIAAALRTNFDQVFPEVTKVFFHREDFFLPFQVFGGANATGSLTVVAGLLFFLLQDSLYAASLVVSFSAFFGQLAIFHSLHPSFPAESRRRVLIGATLVPSVVFWSSTIAKEAVVVACLGAVMLLVRAIVQGKVKPVLWVVGALFVVPVAMIKPYVLLPLVLAASVWFYWQRSTVRETLTIRPIALIVGALLAFGGVAAIGWVSPQFAVDNLARSTANIQAAGERVEGGSNFQLTEVNQEAEVSASRQLLLTPIALPTALFRPFIFEVRNPMMFVNALETTVLLVLTLRLLVRGGWAWLRRRVLSSPALVFCLAFTVLLGTAVGLASTNLGSLSRYRLPFMPFFVTLLLVLDGLLEREVEQRRAVALGALRTEASAK